MLKADTSSMACLTLGVSALLYSFFSCDHPAQVLVWVQRVNTLQKICGLSKAYGDWCLKLSAILLTC